MEQLYLALVSNSSSQRGGACQTKLPPARQLSQVGPGPLLDSCSFRVTTAMSSLPCCSAGSPEPSRRMRSVSSPAPDQAGQTALHSGTCYHFSSRRESGVAQRTPGLWLSLEELGTLGGDRDEAPSV